ncbi:Branched-chain amino acid transport protein (AzlD) [Dethiosulfatibacter aminovorans DSM 17477]|uniref:Branched-chain amino acid transport protein (AzlD) n=1 Tax=Dethiosulfatibacter aminovorans DSM 17477 TaxID=1121476 RepID=A0A1M6AWX0_9FIRM|nr:AzlD domain-containing protein [Dethiosulfatibacter aminovorans]SHI40994.1 Branched-chain amino acid transport protein (AzlD) [Dethiosulfatibacter aminovorans DSM 17477]
MNNIMFIILGMMIATYLPRLVPFMLISGKPLPLKVKRFLEYVPYTALGALIIPGALGAVPERPVASVLGLGFAVAYSYLRGGIIVTVAGSIATVYLVLVYL